ncbi:Aste57867_19107 [Aphanomyces stellatus]|uniref:Aste57867_19107 protein n=1 Tax=Aphanomyces stellatus TaxID=120398 RepID=A0A485LCM1_9STRA|nr:hypothetical protein As57867_019043 [Aphanomyces stellatus]KAF0705408.1 hypothetical protein As57867_007027 [Aphanomyces stellatus]VFT83995.1 Aste57867_7050 [Aphanomyces stellatus]VFT95831.1 Aste57867_19107 [Aphanomyces stellatus]
MRCVRGESVLPRPPRYRTGLNQCNISRFVFEHAHHARLVWHVHALKPTFPTSATIVSAYSKPEHAFPLVVAVDPKLVAGDLLYDQYPVAQARTRKLPTKQVDSSRQSVTT